MTDRSEESLGYPGIQDDVLSMIKSVDPEEQQSLVKILRGKNLILTGRSSYKFWIYSRDGKVQPARDSFYFYEAHIQILEVLFASDLESLSGRQFGLIVETTEQIDTEQLPRLVHEDDIVSLINPFPIGFEGADVELVIKSAKPVFQAVVTYPELSRLVDVIDIP